jgi:rhodanese-related sulfurtransferase
VKQISILALLMFFMTSLTHAFEMKQESFTVVTSDIVKMMIDLKEPGLVVIDVRSPQEFQEVHIRGALNIPLAILEKSTVEFNFPKAAKIVIYSNGFKCDKSQKAARIASSSGYGKLYVLSEGMPVWEEKRFAIYAGPAYEKQIETINIAPKVLQSMRADIPSRITLVDVRDANEYAVGHIPGAINIPVNEFAAHSSVLEKDKKIIVYSNSGGRSYSAYRKLKKMEYGDICQAIYADWQGAGLPVSIGAEPLK